MLFEPQTQARKSKLKPASQRNVTFFSGVWDSRFCDEIIKSPEKIMASRGGIDVFLVFNIF